MPYVRRNEDNKIIALFVEATDEATEFLEKDDPQLAEFYDPDSAAFSGLDSEFIRVIEDVVDVLIQKGVMHLTDLPEKAQEKLMNRKGFRDRRSDNALDLLGDTGEEELF